MPRNEPPFPDIVALSGGGNRLWGSNVDMGMCYYMRTDVAKAKE